MITPLWFSNALDWIAQVAVLVLAAGLLPHIFKIRQPRVLLTYWRTLVGISLLLPLVQPWHRQFYLQVEFTRVTLSNSEISQFVSRTHQLTYWQAHKAELIAQTFAVIILAGIAARFTILALGLRKLRQFRRASSPIVDHAASSAVLDEMRVRVNTGGEFRISSDVDSPVTFGLSAPVILLPERFPTLDAQYQSAIACHELFHVRRRDWAHHLSEEILRATLWFHPAIAWLVSRIRLSREQVVDLEVVKLTDARKPYLEALLEFTNSRALAAAIPAPPFLVERQLAERVALMLKEVRMSRTRLIASLTAITACLGVVATLAVWTFPLKAAPRAQQNPPQGVVQGVPGGITGGVTQGVIGGVTGGIINGVPGGITAGVPSQGVKGGVSNGASGSGPATLTDSYVGPTPRDSGTLFVPPTVRKLPLDVASARPAPAPKIVVTDIKFQGEVHDADAMRARVIKYSQAKNWDATDPDWLDELAEVGVRGDFQNHGYFEAVVDGAKSQLVDSTPTQQRVVASFHVKEGDQFRAGEFTFVGFDPARGPAIPVAQLRDQFHLQTGEILNVDELRHGIQMMENLYGARGYMDFTATPDFTIDRQGRTVAMKFTLHEENQYRVASFVVHGLDSATTANLQSKIRPGSVYDNSLMRELFDQGNAASGANVRWVDGIHVTRNINARTVDIVLDFSPKSPQPAQQQDDKSNQDLAVRTKRSATPVYPHQAIENHLEGRVNLTLTVNAEGKVSNVEFINGSSEFIQAATDAAYQWEFQPPAKAPAIVTARFDFNLSPSRGHAPFVEAPKNPRAVGGISVAIAAQDPSPQSAPTPATNIDSRFIGKLQNIPPADASSGKFQNIPPVVTSSPARGLIGPGQPPPATNQGVFLNVTPAASANSRTPNPQNISSPVYRAGQNGVTMPKCEYCPRPEYSPEARDANIQGTVDLQVTVLTTGRAGEIKVTRSLEKSLDREAIKVVSEQWTFKPATDRNGDPVEVIVPIEITFLLFGPPQPTLPSTGRSAAASSATAPLTPNESLQAKIFTGPVTDNGTSTPFYMGLVKAQTVYAPQPEVPRLARQAHVQGPVTLNIVVNTEGKVIVAEYVKGSAMLVQSAIDTVRNWIIKGTHDGVPVTFQISVEVSFSDK